MEELIQFDKQLLLWFNGSESLFLDSLITTLTNAKTWIPLYLSLFYVVVKSNQTVRDVFLILAAAGLCVLLAGTIDDTIVKPTVARWRPGHDPQIGMLVDTVNGYRGGNYGFFSAHASNTFSIAIFFSLLMRQRLFTIFMVCWSLINCYTRLYLGVHYPGDILVGLSWGAIVGTSVYYLYRRVLRLTPTSVPATYTPAMCDIPIAVLVLTIVFALLQAYVQI
jgi:undecaprenyl-diphosphatase